ncbi:MAG: MFS transporter [Gemmatimonadetes bacterium 13_1_40CM_70_11]|nr:MAG: MFS transporter [Gemmatimonadetes bacterium 13_1_40CM_70_11]
MAEAQPVGTARLVRRGLAVLTLVNLFNYLDRYVLAALGESLARSPLHITDTQFGVLASGFIVVYMLAAPVFGTLGDTRSRTRLIAVGILLWSLATALGGLACGFVSLLVARALVGVGEAAYGTIAPSLLADYYPRSHRGRVFSIFFAAIPIGSALGYMIGGQVDVHFGWRSALFVAGVPGLALAALALRLYDPPRGVHEAGDSADAGRRVVAGAARAAYAALIRNRPYVLTVLGYAAYTFALGAMAVFLPKFLIRVRGLSEGPATLWSGISLAATGFLGTFAGGWIGDRLLPLTRQAYLWVSGIATLVAAPVALLALASGTPVVYWTGIVVAEILLFSSTGPINSAIVNVVAPEIRATAMAVSIFTIHVLGDVPSPTVVGAISDASSLARAVLLLPLAVLVSGAIWIYAAWRGEVTERAAVA